MNNKKIATIIFILLTASIAAVIGAFVTLHGTFNASVFTDFFSHQKTNTVAVESKKTAAAIVESDFEKCGKYNDIKPSDSYCWLTRIMRDRNIFMGDANGNFNPNQPVTRAEFAKIIIRTLYGRNILIESPTDFEGSRIGFSDLSGRDWAYPYIYAAKEKGLIGGYPDGTFRYANNVTRAEFSKILYSRLPDFASKLINAKNYLLSRWPDPYGALGFQAGQWYSDYLVMLLYADSFGAFLQDCGGKVCPDRPMTRLEIAAAIEKTPKIFDAVIGFGNDDQPITADIAEDNCSNIRALSDMTGTLKNLGLNVSVIGQCAKTYPQIWTSGGQTHPAAPDNSNPTGITGDLSTENCIKIKKLANMTATLTSLGIDLNLMSKCASTYKNTWYSPTI